MEGLGDIKNYEKQWLLRLKNMVSGVTVNRTVAGNKRSAPVPDPDKWSRKPTIQLPQRVSLSGRGKL